MKTLQTKIEFSEQDYTQHFDIVYILQQEGWKVSANGENDNIYYWVLERIIDPDKIERITDAVTDFLTKVRATSVSSYVKSIQILKFAREYKGKIFFDLLEAEVFIDVWKEVDKIDSEFMEAVDEDTGRSYFKVKP